MHGCIQYAYVEYVYIHTYSIHIQLHNTVNKDILAP